MKRSAFLWVLVLFVVVLLCAPRARSQQLATRGTIAPFEQTDSPVITDGEQAKPSLFSFCENFSCHAPAVAKATHGPGS